MQGGGGTYSELTGYNAKRHEFEPEYDQDAELLIAELEFKEDDTEVSQPLSQASAEVSLSIFCTALFDHAPCLMNCLLQGLMHALGLHTFYACLTSNVCVKEDKAEKLRVVEVYNARLSGRERRRNFIRDRGLLNVKRMQVQSYHRVHTFLS